MVSGRRRRCEGGRQHGGSVIASCRGPRAVKEPGHAWKLHPREPGDPVVARAGRRCPVPVGSRGGMSARRWAAGERRGGNPSMNDDGKSDGLVVPAKPPNNAALRWRRWWREGGRPRGTRPAKHAPDTEPEAACQVRWIACAGWRAGIRRHGSPRCCTTSMSTGCGTAYRALNPRAATGVDDVTWRDYGRDLEDESSGTCTPGSIAAAIERGRPGGRISPSRTGVRAVGGRRVGGQDPAARRRGGAQRHL